MAFARRQFELSAPQEDGLSLLAHLQAVEKKTGVVDELIANAPPLPSGLEQLWAKYLSLHESRGSTGFGMARITYSDIAHFKSVTGAMLSPWEVDAIRKLDNLWLSEFAPKPKGDK